MLRYAEDWFEKRLADIPCTRETRTYIAGVMMKYVVSNNDNLCDRSIVLAWAEARDSHDIVKFQRLGDWILWSASLVPQSFDSLGIVQAVGQQSYDACYRLLRRQWKLYDELASDLPRIVSSVNQRLQITP
jgi:hypothetical protein